MSPLPALCSNLERSRIKVKWTIFIICSTEWKQISLQVIEDNLEIPDSSLAGMTLPSNSKYGPHHNQVYSEIYFLLPIKWINSQTSSWQILDYFMANFLLMQGKQKLLFFEVLNKLKWFKRITAFSITLWKIIGEETTVHPIFPTDLYLVRFIMQQSLPWQGYSRIKSPPVELFYIIKSLSSTFIPYPIGSAAGGEFNFCCSSHPLCSLHNSLLQPEP